MAEQAMEPEALPLPQQQQEIRVTTYDALSKLAELPGAEQMCHDVCDVICNRGPGNKQQFPVELDDIIRSLKAYIAHVYSAGLSADDIRKELEQLQIAKKSAELVIAVVEGRRLDLSRAYAEAVAQLSSSYLVDFDWKIHLVMASDTCASIQEPRLLLELYVQQADNKRQVLVELSLEDLDSLLSEFSNIQQVIRKVTF